jgi:hypothetical protein
VRGHVYGHVGQARRVQAMAAWRGVRTRGTPPAGGQHDTGELSGRHLPQRGAQPSQAQEPPASNKTSSDASRADEKPEWNGLRRGSCVPARLRVPDALPPVSPDAGTRAGTGAAALPFALRYVTADFSPSMPPSSSKRTYRACRRRS